MWLASTRTLIGLRAVACAGWDALHAQVRGSHHLLRFTLNKAVLWQRLIGETSDQGITTEQKLLQESRWPEQILQSHRSCGHSSFFFFFLSRNASRFVARHVCDVTYSPRRWPTAPQRASVRAVGAFSAPLSQRTTIMVKEGPTYHRAEPSPPTGWAFITTTRTRCPPLLVRTLAVVPAPSPPLCHPDDAVIIAPSAPSSRLAAVAAVEGAPAASPGVTAIAGPAAMTL